MTTRCLIGVVVEILVVEVAAAAGGNVKVPNKIDGIVTILELHLLMSSSICAVLILGKVRYKSLLRL
jgi:hypothetical protein